MLVMVGFMTPGMLAIYYFGTFDAMPVAVASAWLLTGKWFEGDGEYSETIMNKLTQWCDRKFMPK